MSTDNGTAPSASSPAQRRFGYVCLLLLGGFIVYMALTCQPRVVPPFAELQMVEGAVQSATHGDTDGGEDGYMIRIEGRPEQFLLLYESSDRVLGETLRRELAENERIRLWYGGEKYQKWYYQGYFVWQLEKDGKLLRSYDDAVRHNAAFWGGKRRR